MVKNAARSHTASLATQILMVCGFTGTTTPFFSLSNNSLLSYSRLSASINAKTRLSYQFSPPGVTTGGVNEEGPVLFAATEAVRDEES